MRVNHMSLRLNPEYEKLLPKMSDQEFGELKESIRTDGQHYPIIVNENLEVLDGHHRFRACIELNIEPDFEVRKFEDRLVEKKFVIEANLRRRHLNNFQLVELAVPLLEVEKAIAKKRQVKGGENGENILLGETSDDVEPELKAKATEIVTKKAGVSTRTFERGKKILETASEDQKQRLREGKTSISKVYSEVAGSRIKKQKKLEAVAPSDPRFEENKTAFLALVKSLVDQGLFCPSCGSKLFECCKCHKALQDLAQLQLNDKPS